MILLLTQTNKLQFPWFTYFSIIFTVNPENTVFPFFDLIVKGVFIDGSTY